MQRAKLEIKFGSFIPLSRHTQWPPAECHHMAQADEEPWVQGTQALGLCFPWMVEWAMQKRNEEDTGM